MNMKKWNMKKNSKIVITCLSVLVCTFATIVISKAAGANNDIQGNYGIIYSSYDMSNYWKDDTKTAPVKLGYIFAGWYVSEDGEKVHALNKDELDATDLPENTYAKFVPDSVLTVKTQVEAKAEVTSTSEEKPDSTYMRVLSTVDSGAYEGVGFEILYGEAEIQGSNKEPITAAYKRMKLSKDSTEVLTATEVFESEASQYFIALDIKNIGKSSYSSKIYVRPYWITLDGTKVEGFGKYVRVEDKYTDYDYISVPVNLLTDGANPVKVAAGTVEVEYDQTKFSVANIDTGRLLKEMTCHVDEENGIIKFVANEKTVDNYITADGLYASIRFDKKTGNENATENDLKLTKRVIKFIDWKEEVQDVNVW